MAASTEKKKADLKIVIVGDACVGKTSFIRRYMDGVFTENPGQTVGACFFLKQWGQYNVALWDTAGEERFSGLSSFYCRDAAAAIVAYDVTRRSTFEVLQERYIPLLEAAKEDCLLCVTGMKVDLLSEEAREVSQEDARNFSRRLNASRFQNIHKHDPGRKMKDPFFESSSKTGKNVEEVFEYIFNSLLPSNGVAGLKKERDTLDLKGEQTPPASDVKRKGCCS